MTLLVLIHILIVKNVVEMELVQNVKKINIKEKIVKQHAPNVQEKLAI